MTVWFSDSEIDRLIREDIPYFDLTTTGLGISQIPGRIEFSTRHPTVVCGVEEAVRILTRCGATVEDCVASGTYLPENTTILTAEGSAGVLHQTWRVALNLMEHASGIATRTKTLVDIVRSVNPKACVVTTRKVLPGTKALSVKAVLAGGAQPHRLGLSETVLVFDRHLAFLGGIEGFVQFSQHLRERFPEKAIGVEVSHEDDAFKVAKTDIDFLQFDKFSPEVLTRTVKVLQVRFPRLKLAAAGGIDRENIATYAATGVSSLVTSWPYFGKPADLGVQLYPRSPE
ncbi:pyrophosphorylase [Leptolyngbya valderiana BDU 20041]|uniref:ModD protein n=1 Tax=Baaleninema simplex TaxID=2862350 RepID=UPI0003453A2B|nr:ModD protein [Baaleninema simplex]OAB62028.1 pyrophosphorylase [Leptolyngbya valderiana BDU 20041]PPT05763.1 Molybdenum transport system protein ModD [Geitlerinema sp. FC II]